MKLSAGAAAALLVLGLSACSTTPKVAQAPVCQSFSVAIYFERDSFSITRDGRGVLNAAADRARGCTVTHVDVVGLADAVGDPNINLQLSEKRAAEVTNLLARRSIGNVRVLAAGEFGAQAPTGEARPLRRRVEITFQLAAP